MKFNNSRILDPHSFFQIEQTPCFSNQKNKLLTSNTSTQNIKRKKSLETLNPKRKPIRTEIEDKLTTTKLFNFDNHIQKSKTIVQILDEKQNNLSLKKNKQDSRHQLQTTSKIEIKANYKKVQSARETNSKQGHQENKKGPELNSYRDIGRLQENNNKININLTEVLRQYNSRSKSKEKLCLNKNEEIQRIFIKGLRKRMIQLPNDQNVQKIIETQQKNKNKKYQSNCTSKEKENFEKPQLVKLNLKSKRVSKPNNNRYY